MSMILGNLANAVQLYQQSAANSQAQFQRQKQMEALKALGSMFGQGGDAPQGPTTPPIAAPPAPTNPNNAGGPAPGPMPLPAPNANAPSFQAPGAMPTDAAPPPPDPGLSSTAQPKAAGMDDPILAAQQSIKTMAAGIKAANPKIDPITLAMAVQSQIENIKGVSPLTKSAMTYQVQMIAAQQRQQVIGIRQQQIDQNYQIALDKEKDAKRRLDILEAWHNATIENQRAAIDERYYAADRSAGARVQSAEIGAGSREKVAGINAGSREKVAGIGADSREKVAGIRAETAEDVADTSAASRERSARIRRSGSKVTGDAPRSARSFRNPNARGAGGPPVPGARKAPDGHWYVQKGNQFFKVE